MQTLYLIIASLLMLPGLVGIVIPIFPGIPYMFIVALIYGFVTHFNTLTYKEMIVLGLIALVSFLIDYLSGIFGAKYGGAAKKSIFFGLLGSVIGTIVLPPFGGILGLFLGIIITELILHNDHKKALKAASGSLFGSLVGMIVNLILAILFFILFVIFALR